MTEHICPNVEGYDLAEYASMAVHSEPADPIYAPLDACDLCQTNNCRQTIEDGIILHSPVSCQPNTLSS